MSFATSNTTVNLHDLLLYPSSRSSVNEEVKRRTGVIGIFPSDANALRLLGMMPAKQHAEWQVSRRQSSAESLTKLDKQLLPVELSDASTRPAA